MTKKTVIIPPIKYTEDYTDEFKKAADSKMAKSQDEKPVKSSAKRAGVIETIAGFDWVVIGICVLLFFVAIFLYNLIRENRAVTVDAADIKGNIAVVEDMQKSNVEDIEKQVEELDAADNKAADEDESDQARYKRLLANAVVVGDSVTEGLTVYGWLSEGQVFSEIGASIISGEDMFNKGAKLFPKYAFFAFGMNDMGNYSGNADKFIARYRELLRKFQSDSPDTKMYICSISIPNEDAIAANKSIGNYEKFNKAIEKMCQEEGYTYVDSTFILKDHPDFYAGDGIHVSTNYYPYWLDNMIKAAGIR